MNNNEYPPQYILGLVKLDPNIPFEEEDVLNSTPVETYIFDILEEGGLLVASCNEHHIIISAPNWRELEPKINNAFRKDVEKKHDI